MTLTIIDRVCHDLAVMSANDCLAKVEFGDVVVISDKKLNVPGARWYVRNLCDYDDVFKVHWNVLPQLINTSHFLVVQYDSWVLDTSMWIAKFLEFDYIGAPWKQYHDPWKVGNGGFSLRSTAFARWAAEHLTFKQPEDEALCRTYRRELEGAGFKFAPLWAANIFAFEDILPRKTFGFHGIFNWPFVLDADRLNQRVALLPSQIKAKTGYHKLLGNLKAVQAMV